MSNEIVIIQQENELLKARLELATIQAKQINKLDDSLFSPQLYDHYRKIAETFAKSELVPKDYRNKPDNAFIAMAMGYQLGFSVEQSLQNIAVINGRPCVWGDALMALILSHNQLEYVKEQLLSDSNGKVYSALCVIKRKGHDEHAVEFSLDDAKKANLLGKPGPWTQYPNRMMQLRARGFAIRDKFADALMGIQMVEEVQDYIEGEVINSPAKPKAQQRLNHLLEKNTNDILNSKTIDGAIVENFESVNKTMDSKAYKPTKKKAVENPVSQNLDEIGEQETVVNNSANQDPITPQMIVELENLIELTGFDNDRLAKALRYFDIDKLEDLTIDQGIRFKTIINLPKKED
jgi:hypothetical protein